MKMRSYAAAMALSLGVGLLATGTALAEPKTNFLSQWDTGSDAAAIAKLGDMFNAAGGKWQATSIAGHTANTLAKLRADVVAGNAPPAVQLKGPEIAEWNETGKTANLDPIAQEEGWEKVVAPELLPVMKPKGQWVAVPMNIHRINWLWGSKKALDKAGITEMPKTWAEFNDDCEKLKKAGIAVPVAYAAADWIDATFFETIVYGMDQDLFRNAFVRGDLKALASDGMAKAFDEYRVLLSYTDAGRQGRDWDAALGMMAKGESGFYIMGDWSVGTLNASNFKYGEDYLCTRAPQDDGKPGFILNADSVVFFTQKDPDYISGQKLLAHLIMSTDFQKIFNLAKGSIPARMDVDMSTGGWNPCQQTSQKDLADSIKAGTLVRSMAHNMTVLQKYRGAMMEVITEFEANPSTPSKDVVKKLADAVEAQM